MRSSIDDRGAIYLFNPCPSAGPREEDEERVHLARKIFEDARDRHARPISFEPLPRGLSPLVRSSESNRAIRQKVGYNLSEILRIHPPAESKCSPLSFIRFARLFSPFSPTLSSHLPTLLSVPLLYLSLSRPPARTHTSAYRARYTDTRMRLVSSLVIAY